VSDWVDEVCGLRLAERRRAMARLEAAPPVALTAPARTPAPAVRDRVEHREATTSSDRPVSRVSLRRRRPLLHAGIGALASVVAAALLAWGRAAEPGPPPPVVAGPVSPLEPATRPTIEPIARIAPAVPAPEVPAPETAPPAPAPASAPATRALVPPPGRPMRQAAPRPHALVRPTTRAPVRQTSASALSEVAGLNRQAAQAYAAFEVPRAVGLLTRALRLCARAGLTAHDLNALTHLNMGAVLVGGFGQRDLAARHFRLARVIRPDIFPSGAMASRDVLLVFHNAVGAGQ
jgi:hypothetical protein